MSEEDRSTETALEYWYRVIDLDDDHVVSLYELEQLWEHQEERLLQDSNAMFDFRDILCVVSSFSRSFSLTYLGAVFIE
jgi:serine/threonine-protein phosphatase 2A regulatory subunit B''